MFSSRLRQTAGRNRLAAAVDGRRAAGLPIIDLTLSNPTRAGLAYPKGMLAPMAHDRALCYDPEPFGMLSARQAVSRHLAGRGVSVSADRVVLTASTSEAYALLFKLLCDSGDTVLAPRPSYPLVEHLTDLEGVSLEQYPLVFHGRWELDVERLRQQARMPRTRAIVSISPNNPTGSVLTDEELEAVASIARDHNLAVISDEVFAEYPLTDEWPASALRPSSTLTFVLGGLSKSVGLPQVKVGWIAVGGDDQTIADAMERLETICDAYLSVSTPAQVAIPDLLSAGESVRSAIHERVRENYRLLVESGVAHPACRVMRAEAGWYAVVQVPAVASEESIVIDLLEQTGVLVHPGYFFDFEREAFLVISLLPAREVFASGVQALFGQIGSTR